MKEEEIVPSPTTEVVANTETKDETQEPVMEEPPVEGMSLVGHLEEFRMRIMVSLVAVIIGGAISWFYAGEIINFLAKPVGKLVFLSPGEAFFAYLKVAVFTGLLLALPVVMHQIWSFVLPALHENERKIVLFLGPASVLLFLTGIAFSYYAVLPAAIKFFMGFATDQLQPVISLGAYISFIISFLLPFGIVFELPLFLIVLAKFGVISSQFLAGKRKIFLILAFVIGAVASPTPDIFSQVMVAIPLLMLYELSIFVIKYGLKR